MLPRLPDLRLGSPSRVAERPSPGIRYVSMTETRTKLRRKSADRYDMERRVLSIGGLAMTVGLLAYMAVAL